MKSTLCFVLLAATVYAAELPHKPAPLKQLRTAAAQAVTADEHHRVAADLRRFADWQEREADRLAQVAQQRRDEPTVDDVKRPNAPGTMLHALHFERVSRTQAKEARHLALRHEELARAARDTQPAE